MIDAHHHLWDTAVREYAWMDGEWADPLRGRFDVARYVAESSAGASIAVQAVHDVAETRQLLSAGTAGVVGWVDLTAPDVADQVRVLRSLGPLVGLRHQAQDEPDPEWLLRPSVAAGIRASGLAFDLLVKAPQWAAALELVRRLPDVSFVLDHGGKPDILDRVWEPWAGWIMSLSELPNVSVKLSGLVTEASWTSWKPSDLLPYARHLLDAFGPSRVMFGSDWPVCTLAAGYDQVEFLAADACAELSGAERDEVFDGTARRIYGVGQAQ